MTQYVRGNLMDENWDQIPNAFRLDRGESPLATPFTIRSPKEAQAAIEGYEAYFDLIYLSKMLPYDAAHQVSRQTGIAIASAWNLCPPTRVEFVTAFRHLLGRQQPLTLLCFAPPTNKCHCQIVIKKLEEFANAKCNHA